MAFSEMADLEIRIAIDQIMFRGAVSSGCLLPQTELFSKFISEGIEEFVLKFGYADYTLDELLLALMLNANGTIKNPAGTDLEQVQFQGNCINLVYLAKVFNNYRTLRNNLDARLRNLIDGHQ